MRLILAFLLSLFVFSVQAVDAPPQGEPEDYANYYTGVKKDGLQPFWKALPNMSEHEKNFIVSYREMHKSKDAEILETLIHPSSLACEDDLRAPYFASMREFYLTENFPKTFEMKYFPIESEKRWPLKLRMEFPVAPTHILYIEYKDDGYVEGLQRFLRLEEYPQRRFYELIKCPSEASMKTMIQEAEKRLQLEETSDKQQ